MKRVSRKRRIVGLSILAGIPVLLCACADRLIFLPPEATYGPSERLLMIPTANGEKIAAFYLPPASNSDPVVIFSHGNAEDIGWLHDYARIYNQLGFGILAYDYRGYGQSEGKPSERNAYLDVEAVFQYLLRTEKIPPSRMIAHGRSVGSGPSVWLAVRHPIGGLILESPFVSIFRVVTRWPIIPFDKFNNLSRMRHVTCPVLVIHGQADTMIPLWHGQTLYEAAGDPKMCYWVPGADHNDLLDCAGDRYWQTLETFKALVEQTSQHTKAKNGG